MAPAKDHGTKATPWPFIPWPRGLDGFLSAGAVQCSSTRRWMLLMASKLPGPSSFWINYISKPELSLKIGAKMAKLRTNSQSLVSPPLYIGPQSTLRRAMVVV